MRELLVIMSVILGFLMLNQSYAIKILTVGDFDCTEIFTNYELHFIILKSKQGRSVHISC